MNTESQILERRDIHLLVIDDDDRIRNLLKRYLGKAGFRISTASNAKKARQLMESLSFDMLILDVMMPGEDGLSLTRALREHDDIPIILLTALGEAPNRIKGLKTGADDYLSKPFEPEELVLRIDGIMRRVEITGPGNKIDFGPWTFDTERLVLSKNGGRVKLTSGEEALLTLLAKRAGTPVSRHALSEKINARSDRAVDVQMTRLRRKIEEKPSEPAFLLTVRGLGYRLLADAF